MTPTPPATPQPAPSGLRQPLQQLLKNKPLLAGIAGGAMLLLVLIAWFAFSGGSDEEYAEDDEELAEEGDTPASSSKKTKNKKGKNSRATGVPLLPPKFATHDISIYTPQPGFL